MVCDILSFVKKQKKKELLKIVWIENDFETEKEKKKFSCHYVMFILIWIII